MYEATQGKKTDEEAQIGPDYEFYDTSEDVERLARRLLNERLVAVDVEADSLYHFRERVCLLQISAGGGNFVVDPLSRADLSPLAPVFADPGIRKVFHGADYDIRSLFRDFGIKVMRLFDTQVAARFLGARETGLASILSARYRVNLSKKHQKSNWTRRPLSGEMLSYAVSDTAHLPGLYEDLRAELTRAGRLSWVEEECSILAEARPAEGGGPLFLRVKGAGRMDPESLAVLESVLCWRKEEARRRDVPPFKVIPDSAALSIAQVKALEPDRLARAAGLSGRQVNLAPALARCVAEALELPADRLPAYPKKPRFRTDAKTAARTLILKDFRDRLAAELDIDSSLVLTNAQIRDISARPRRCVEDLEGVPNLRRWQKETFGKELVEALAEVDRGPVRASESP